MRINSNNINRWCQRTGQALALVLAISFFLVSPACSQQVGGVPDSPPPPTATKTVDEMLKESQQYRTFYQILERSTVKEAIARALRVTLFVPEELSFMQMDSQYVKTLLSDPQKATQFVEAHAAIGRFPQEKLEVVKTIQTLNRQKLFIEYDGAMVSGRRITSYDLWGSNGVIHSVSAPLTEP